MAHELVITQVGEDEYEIERNRRPMLHVPADLDYVKTHVQRVRLPDEKVILVDREGQRRDVTKEYARNRRRR